MSIQDITNSRLGVALGIAIGQAIPPRQGYSIANRVGDWMAASKKRKMVRAVRANQWVASGEKLTSPELDAITRQTFRNTGRCLYDLYHTMNSPEQITAKVALSPRFQAFKKRITDRPQRCVFVCPHMSNFDLAGRALGLKGLKFIVLSIPNPIAGYRWLNDMRERTGLEILPMSVSALRVAVERLHAGGIVLTGVDRPLNDSNYRPKFFGRPAYLPVAHVRLALKTRSPVYVVSCITDAEGIYTLDLSDPVEMKSYPDREDEIICNAEPILQRVEEFIRLAPAQWSMFYPVWPEAMAEMPGARA